MFLSRIQASHTDAIRHDGKKIVSTHSIKCRFIYVIDELIDE